MKKESDGIYYECDCCGEQVAAVWSDGEEGFHPKPPSGWIYIGREPVRGADGWERVRFIYLCPDCADEV